MSLTPQQTAVMEALVESSDSRVSARDRIDAARVLADAGAAAEPEGAAILTREVAALSDAALEREVDLFLRPDVERQVAGELRRRGAALDAREAAVAAREAALDEREARFAAMGVEAAERAAGDRNDPLWNHPQGRVRRRRVTTCGRSAGSDRFRMGSSSSPA